jgi:hypothetical protein
MKLLSRFIQITAITILFSSCMVSPYHREDRTRMYNSQGHYTGYEVKQGDRTRYYNEKSQYQGYSIKDSTGRTRYYNEKGKYKGYSEE